MSVIYVENLFNCVRNFVGPFQASETLFWPIKSKVRDPSFVQRWIIPKNYIVKNDIIVKNGEESFLKKWTVNFKRKR